jgi:DNA-directed RNA polymerase specialized sigma24 family protein
MPEDNHIFSRERKTNEQRALGMLLYYAGLSYEKAGSFVNASHEAVRKWSQ